MEFNNLYNALRSRKNDAKDVFKLRILSLGGDLNIDNFKDNCSKQLKQVIQSDFGLNRGHLQGFKSATLGRTDDLKMEFVGFDIKTIYKVRVYHGSAFRWYKILLQVRNRKQQDPVMAAVVPQNPKRDYLSKMFRSKLNISNQSHHEQSPQQLTNGSGGETYCFSWERNWELLGIHFQSK